MPLQETRTTTNLTDAEIKELQEVFNLMDKDRSGTLSVSEVHELLQLLGMANTRLEDVQKMVAEIDVDNSGTVDFDEFLQVAAKPQQLQYSKADLMRSFRMFADRKAPAGCIVPETLEAALLQHCQHLLDPAEISRLVHTIDINADGYINFREMVSLFVDK